MTACVFCDGEVTSTKPDVDYCRDCFYEGRWATRRFIKLLLDMSALGVPATPWHSGGGCFALMITVPGGYLLASADGDGSLPDTEAGPWWVGNYVTGEDDDEGDDSIIAEHLDRAALLTTIARRVS